MGQLSMKNIKWESLLSPHAFVGFAWTVACILQTVAVALPQWGKASLPTGISYKEGLWRHCYSEKCDDNLLSRTDPTNPGFQVQSLEVPGLVLIVCMACHWWMAMTREIRSHVQDWIFVVLGGLGGFLILAGIAIYGKKNVFLGVQPLGVTEITLHSSFALACVVFILSTVALIGSVYLTVQHHLIQKAPWKYRPY